MRLDSKASPYAGEEDLLTVNLLSYPPVTNLSIELQLIIIEITNEIGYFY